jgi:glucosamine--fructose-6-phosphate aminotransferase (isomerizing)
MCGIVGYIGERRASEILIEGLKRLEYRGYDSAGMCVVSRGNMALYKKKGRVAELQGDLPKIGVSGDMGISHTRWATHGEPNETNAHPHLDCTNQIAIVHNGIIENYQSLKELLVKEGHKIVSATDSEILAHLIEKFYKSDLEDAVLKTLHLVEGAFGLVVIHKNQEKIIAARRGSPMVIGVGKGEMFVASDVSAILDYTKRVIYLNDNEIATLSKTGFGVKDIHGEKVDKKIEEIKWTIDEIEKGGYKHFMLKEIFAQPQALENTLRGHISGSKIKLTVDIDAKNTRRIVLVACGTSWHAGLIGKYYLEQMTGLPVEVDYASEFRYRNPIIDKTDLVIALSQSGETADTLAAIKEAKNKGAKTLGIVNVVGSTIAREVDSGIYVHAGPEIGVASTKAFSSQLVDLLLLALYFRQEQGLKLDKTLIADLQKIPSVVAKVIKSADQIKDLAKHFINAKNFLYLGRGLNFPVALEGALKLKELSYIHAEGYPAAEMKHGPIALIDEDMPVVFVVPKNGVYLKALSNMEEIKARKGKIVAVYNGNDPKVEALADKTIIVPQVREELSPIINNIPLQLLAYYIADMKGLDVDKPRNLAKSVTVE